MIDTLIPLVGWCIQAKNKLKALDYLQKAENILANTTPEAMSLYLSEKSYFTGESFIRFRSADISRKREVLQKM